MNSLHFYYPTYSHKALLREELNVDEISEGVFSDINFITPGSDNSIPITSNIFIYNFIYSSN